MIKVYSIGYHDVFDAGSDNDRVLRHGSQHYALSRHDFRQHLSKINEKAIAPVRTVYEAAGAQTSITLTFDDGGAGALECIAPEVEALGWRGHFFITTGWIGQPGFMKPAQLRELHRRGHVIGSHTATHPSRMSSLSWAQLIREWSESCAVLSDILSAPVNTASVADGYYSGRVGTSAACAGIKFLFNSEPTASVLDVDGCLVLGRYSIKAASMPAESGAIAAGEKWLRWKQAATWEAKKVVKTMGGEPYLRFRQKVLQFRSQEN